MNWLVDEVKRMKTEVENGPDHPDAPPGFWYGYFAIALLVATPLAFIIVGLIEWWRA